MKYRKKPIVIEAEQWFSDKEIDGVQKNREDGSFLTYFDELGVLNQAAFIETLEGKMLVKQGDWIITGIEGEKYPCKPDIFEKTYEPFQEIISKIKFKKKNDTSNKFVEAEQWFLGKTIPGVSVHNGSASIPCFMGEGYTVGYMKIEEGAWIIREDNGRICALKNDVFEEMYQPYTEIIKKEINNFHNRKILMDFSLSLHKSEMAIFSEKTTFAEIMNFIDGWIKENNEEKLK